MKVVKTLTPESVGDSPLRFRAACLDCRWSTVRVRFPESVEPLASEHVWVYKHRVEIGEEE